ncbi:MAG: chemotaxis protein CheW [Epsilonproteobacteria bacterium]|nr:MAG: chemotaxis protein CheW [Campylobacterota bacterium]
MEDNVEAIIKVQYLFFVIDEESYAVRADKVKEIVDYVQITKIPQTNSSIMGVTNIRGDIIPIIDPKIRFELGNTNIEKRTSFIILNILNQETDELSAIAIIVDLVNEVDNLHPDDILPTPEFGTAIDRNYIKNMLRYNDQYITALDIDAVLNTEELSQK